ncbi:hypothetical protein C8Q77DRAFT_1059067 [Trametes polyzona]|nr:hypothetical protein C8Q77DRAFT_1059067 [Trametes polyzona]
MNTGGRLSDADILNEFLWRDSARVFEALSQAQGAARSSAAALTMLTWDILTTMDQEVSLIWSSEWTLPKSLYLFARYYSLVSLTIQNVYLAVPCVPWLIFQIMSTFLVEAAVEVIIILRVYAVYATQPRVLHIMLLGFAVQVAIMSVSLGLSINKVRTGWDCRAADLPTEMVLYSTASIVYEAFLFGLMMYGIIRGAKDGFSNTTLLNSLVRDGAVAFLAIFLVMLMNTILFTLAPSTLVTMGFPWLLAILGAAGPRLVLNLRAKHANNVGSPSTLGDLRFSVPSHFYSALNPDESESEPSASPTSSTQTAPDHGQDMGEGCDGIDDDDEGEEGEHVALNPRRRTSARCGDIEAAYTPPSPLSPPVPLPK